MEDTITTIQLQINEVARRAGVSIRTVRFYEEKCLLEISSFTSGGIRLYTARDVNRLIFIRRLVKLGMTLEEVRECLGQVPEGPDRQAHVEHTLRLLEMQQEKLTGERRKLDQLEHDIRDSQEKLRRCLQCKAEQCPEQCPSYGQAL